MSADLYLQGRMNRDVWFRKGSHCVTSTTVTQRSRMARLTGSWLLRSDHEIFVSQEKSHGQENGADHGPGSTIFTAMFCDARS
jgi:hypothetical protein